jgi:HEPN domain-containing protein
LAEAEEVMGDRSRDWMAQAKRDLEHAAKDVADGYYEHACFESQQAAGKTVKGVYMRLHADAWGHRVARLLEEVDLGASRPPSELIGDGKLLDQF